MSNEDLVALIKQGIDRERNLELLYGNVRGFIIKSAKRYSGLAEMDDLIQEGYIGLHTAVGKYEPECGTAFLTYAGYWIRQQITRYLEDNGLVRIPSHQYQKMQRLNRLQNMFLNTYGRKPTQGEICACLNISLKQAEELERDAHCYRMESLDALLPGVDGGMTVGDTVPGETDTEGRLVDAIVAAELKSSLWGMVDGLGKEQSKVLRYRFQDRMTLEQAGERLGVTKDKARSHEYIALKRLRAKKEVRQMGRDYGYLHSNAAYHYGLGRFLTSWTSSTEFIALKNLEDN